jgi:hypothetical protein
MLGFTLKKLTCAGYLRRRPPQRRLVAVLSTAGIFAGAASRLTDHPI